MNPVHPDQVVDLLTTGTLSIEQCYGALSHEFNLFAAPITFGSIFDPFKIFRYHKRATGNKKTTGNKNVTGNQRTTGRFSPWPRILHQIWVNLNSSSKNFSMPKNFEEMRGSCKFLNSNNWQKNRSENLIDSVEVFQLWTNVEIDKQFPNRLKFLQRLLLRTVPMQNRDVLLQIGDLLRLLLLYKFGGIYRIFFKVPKNFIVFFKYILIY